MKSVFNITETKEMQISIIGCHLHTNSPVVKSTNNKCWRKKFPVLSSTTGKNIYGSSSN